MIITAEKLAQEIKAINSRTPMKLLRKAMLAKYDELQHRFPAAQFTRDGFTEGSPAENEFVRWYADLRRNKIRGERVPIDKMAVHARWHLRNVFLQQRSVVRNVRAQHQPRNKRRSAA